MSDTGDPKQDKDRELREEREFYETAHSDPKIEDELDEILSDFDLASYDYPDLGMQTPATRIVVRKTHPNVGKSKAALLVIIARENRLARIDELNRLHRREGDGLPDRDYDNVTDEIIDERLSALAQDDSSVGGGKR